MSTDLRRRGSGRTAEPEGPRALAVLRRLRTGGRTGGGRGSRGLLPRAHGESTPAFVLLAASTATLLVLGLIMLFSASFVRSANETGGAFGLFLKQLAICAVGLPPMALAASLDYRLLRRFALPLLVVTLVLSALVLTPLGTEVNGARRWFDLGVISLQPSELLKVAIPLALAHLVSLRWKRVKRGDLRALLVPAVPLLLLATTLVALGPDLEMALLVAAIGATVLYVAGLPTRIVAVAVGAATLFGVLGIVSSGMRRRRFAAWLDPMADAADTGFQTVQGFIALGSGGLFGVGLGASRSKWGYVPNADTDFIFAIIGEELGLIGAFVVLGLFLAIAVGGTMAARRAPDPFGRLLASSITAWLLLQAGINIGSVVGLLPVTGVTLPFVSYGGSSLLFTMVGVGILLSVARAGGQKARDE